MSFLMCGDLKKIVIKHQKGADLKKNTGPSLGLSFFPTLCDSFGEFFHTLKSLPLELMFSARKKLFNPKGIFPTWVFWQFLKPF